MSTVSVDGFELETECFYEGECYLVRDSGAILRKRRPGKRRRPLDDKWTFGNPCDHHGYMTHSNVSVHRVVATAFRGEPPSNDHVVDHIDHNRKNNRQENLRWVTRAENILLNDITRKKVIAAYGSIEAFFENPQKPDMPGLLGQFDWMRTVSKEEARVSRERLESWAASDKPPNGGTFGEYLFVTENPTFESAPQYDDQDIDSLTPGATQRNWKWPSEFPTCPSHLSDNPLQNYLTNLKVGAVFSRNKFGESIVGRADIDDQGTCLSVICTIDSGVKDYALAKVTVEEGKYIHASKGTFFSYDGVEKTHCALIGIEWVEPDGYAGCIDDYC